MASVLEAEVYDDCVMPTLKEIRLKIEASVDGVEWTPETMPMARLVEYLADLSQIMGHKEAVHLMKVEEGSAMPVFYIHADEESRITARMQQAQKGIAVKEANAAYKRFDDRLREDNAIAKVFSTEHKAEIIMFPGRTLDVPKEYSRVRESGQLTGEVKRVGGLDSSVPIWLKRSDGEVLICEADERLASELALHLYKTVRVYGHGTWSRATDGNWKLDRFRIRFFDPPTGSQRNFTDAIKALQDLPGNDWVTMADPLEEARAIRYREELESA